MRGFNLRVHLVTVGASLASHIARKHGWNGPHEVEEKLRRKAVNRKELFMEMVKMLEEKPKEASAEIKTLWNLLERGKVDLAYLLYTDTEVGDLCSRAIQSYLKRRWKIDVERTRIEGYRSEKTFAEGITNLALRAWGLIKKHKGRDRVYVCATGGFKPETALITLIAHLHGIPIYYMHETFRRHIAIPAMPIEWKWELISKYRDPLMELINRKISQEEFHRRFGQEVAKDMADKYWIIRMVNSDYELTPLGRLLYYVFCGRDCN